eukprot:1196368-Prorocentrum_minimum.AAC.5
MSYGWCLRLALSQQAGASGVVRSYVSVAKYCSHLHLVEHLAIESRSSCSCGLVRTKGYPFDAASSDRPSPLADAPMPPSSRVSVSRPPGAPSVLSSSDMSASALAPSCATATWSNQHHNAHASQADQS